MKKNNFTKKSSWIIEYKKHGIVLGDSVTGGMTNKLLDSILINPFIDGEFLNDRFNQNPDGKEKNGIAWTCYHELGHIVSNKIIPKISDGDRTHIFQIFHKAKANHFTTQYGGTNHEEFISEAFADCYLNGDSARSFHKEIFKVMKEMYNKYIKKVDTKQDESSK